MECSSIALENGLDLRQVLTTGSVLQINTEYDDTCYSNDVDKSDIRQLDVIGQPVDSIKALETNMIVIDDYGFVKKQIIEEGGGCTPQDDNTVSIAFSGYWEGDSTPFDTKAIYKPMVLDLNSSGLLPGLDMAVRSMLVGETSVFVLSYQVMYGEMGIPPRIKPRSACIFYIKLLKCVITGKNGKIDFSEPNMFRRIEHEVKLLYSSGSVLFKSNNFSAAIQLFKKGVSMLHKCRLADENEERSQEMLLNKLYINLAVSYNKTKEPLKACVACNELRRLNNYWNNGKVLFQNAKALRMIGQFDIAENRLKKALKLCPNNIEIQHELCQLKKDMERCNQNRLIVEKVASSSSEVVKEEFKKEIDNLIKNFKENSDLYKLVMPSGLNSFEISYIKEACIRENLFINKIKGEFAFDRCEESHGENDYNVGSHENFALDKFKHKSSNDDFEEILQNL
ncbi:hypothetical protein ACJJTC_012132 [Scirpophaga incertulas]